MDLYVSNMSSKKFEKERFSQLFLFSFSLLFSSSTCCDSFEDQPRRSEGRTSPMTKCTVTVNGTLAIKSDSLLFSPSLSFSLSPSLSLLLSLSLSPSSYLRLQHGGDSFDTCGHVFGHESVEGRAAHIRPLTVRGDRWRGGELTREIDHQLRVRGNLTTRTWPPTHVHA